MIGTFDLSAILKIVMPLIGQFISALSQNGADKYNEISNPTKTETNDFVDGFNKSVKEFKNSGADPNTFAALYALPEVTDSASAANAAAAFRQVSIDVAYDPQLKDSVGVFSTNASALDLAARSYTNNI
jgi:hypothetical protein